MNNQRLKQLLLFLKEGSQDPFIKYAIATEYLKYNEFDLALQCYEDLMKNHPDYVGTYYHAGKLSDQLGRRMEAKQVLEHEMKVAKEKQEKNAFYELQKYYKYLIGEN